MQLLRSMFFFCLLSLSLTACSGLASRPWAKQDPPQAAGPAASPGDSQNAREQGKTPPNEAFSQLMDTAKLKADMNNVLNSIASGKPDTNALKTAGKDFLTTTRNMLSDSGIDKLYGNSNDPAVKAAAETLKKFRNATGLTPDKLDSLKKAANLLSTN